MPISQYSSTNGSAEAEAIATLQGLLKKDGVLFHGSASDSLLNFVRHLCTAIETAQSTRDGATPDDDDDDDDLDETEGTETDPAAPPISMSQAIERRRQRQVGKELAALAGFGKKKRPISLSQAATPPSRKRQEAVGDELAALANSSGPVLLPKETIR